MIHSEIDISDVDSFLEDETWEVQKGMIDSGYYAVRHAEEHGAYQDHTLTLRTSNKFDVDEDGVTLENEAFYASFVEAKGFNVLGDSAIWLKNQLKKQFER